MKHRIASKTTRRTITVFLVVCLLFGMIQMLAYAQTSTQQNSKQPNAQANMQTNTKTTAQTNAESSPQPNTHQNDPIKMAAATYRDVTASHWAYPSINLLSEKGVISGYEGGAFKPEASITRAELAKIIILAAGAKTASTDNSSFKDVAADSWALKYIEAAKENGIIAGYPGGIFRPSSKVTRAEIAKMVVAAGKFKTNNAGQPFKDVANGWAYDFVMTAKNLSIIGGYADGTFGPARNATRAETAKIVVGALIEATADTTKPNPVSFTPGSDTQETEVSIGKAGGTLKAASSSSPINGVKVDFPAGALSETATVSLGYNSGSMTPNQGEYKGFALVLNVNGDLSGDIHEFNEPVTITAPLADSGKIPVPFYIEPDGTLHLAQLIGIDRNAGTFSFQTYHASWFTWSSESADAESKAKAANYDTGYSPEKDGFQIANKGAVYNREGECFGLTSFSLWYFQNKKSLKGNFYPKYFQQLGTDSSGKPIRGQNAIATRAYISIMQQYDSYYRDLIVQQGRLSQEERYLTIVNALKNTGNPVLIYLARSNPKGAHSLLAYKYNSLTGTIWVYDPDCPGESKTITFNKDTKEFMPYRGYDQLTYSGDGSLRLTEPYQNILDDADDGFHGSKDAVISVTSHRNGEDVYDRIVTLSGNVKSGQVLVGKIALLNGNTWYRCDMKKDGSFSIPVSLTKGVNHFQFSTAGNTETGKMISLPNNMYTVDFTLNYHPKAQAIMVATLTWNNDNDLDLCVTQPSGHSSSYVLGSGDYFSTQLFSNDGMLSLDSEAYGPEVWTLPINLGPNFDDPYNKYEGDYIIRVHGFNYREKTGPSKYTLKVKLYEGTKSEREYTYQGTITSGNQQTDSKSPFTGPDWDEAATISLTKEEFRSVYGTQ